MYMKMCEMCGIALTDETRICDHCGFVQTNDLKWLEDDMSNDLEALFPELYGDTTPSGEKPIEVQPADNVTTQQKTAERNDITIIPVRPVNNEEEPDIIDVEEEPDDVFTQQDEVNNLLHRLTKSPLYMIAMAVFCVAVLLSLVDFLFVSPTSLMSGNSGWSLLPLSLRSALELLVGVLTGVSLVSMATGLVLNFKAALTPPTDKIKPLGMTLIQIPCWVFFGVCVAVFALSMLTYADLNSQYGVQTENMTSLSGIMSFFDQKMQSDTVAAQFWLVFVPTTCTIVIGVYLATVLKTVHAIKKAMVYETPCSDVSSISANASIVIGVLLGVVTAVMIYAGGVTLTAICSALFALSFLSFALVVFTYRSRMERLEDIEWI